MLKIKNTEKIFKIAGKKKKIVDNVDLNVKQGEIIAITGESGCGKSTILNLISGLTAPDKGSIFLNNKKINYWFDFIPAFNRSRKIGLIFQTFRLIYEETVLSNILLSARIRGKLNKNVLLKIDNLLQKLGIQEYKKTKAGFLSGGQKQRVTIARALVNDPQIILADEPTANLDKKTSIEIFKILENLAEKENRAIIIVTHKEHMLHRADKVFIMQNGKLKLLKNKKNIKSTNSKKSIKKTAKKTTSKKTIIKKNTKIAKRNKK
jgi:ABC-type lipoprotein export system ATPase subunit